MRVFLLLIWICYPVYNIAWKYFKNEFRKAAHIQLPVETIDRFEEFSGVGKHIS